MAIVLDGEVLSAPTIQARLTDGGVITGQFTEEEASTLALQLRSGALPIPLRVESTQEVGATLGQESVRLSIQAGIIGVLVVLAFMLIYYRIPGLAADFALIVFIFLNIAIFKLLPVTLTLPAITGFLISIGTAVDGNILIFERIKEELRDGLPLDDALKAGFERAWTSIRDSNLSTIIICGVLFMFGQTPGASIVAGFAVTLAIGLIVNLFTAVIVTRTFLYTIVGLFHDMIENNRSMLGA
jgi:protein-export membrane protein SecD